MFEQIPSNNSSLSSSCSQASEQASKQTVLVSCMGVHGLTGFIKDVPGLVKAGHRLHNTTIVFDASNLMHLLFQASCYETACYGANMLEFRHEIELFYNNLKKCNIKPILVLDGADEEGEVSKFEENLARAQERFGKVSKVIANSVFPLIVTGAFKAISLEMGAEIHQCMFEADLHVARLGNEHKCPVFSKDSDFYLLDLPCGLVIDIDYKYFYQLGQNYPNTFYIRCAMYNLNNFKKVLPNFDTKCLPLVGILAGNDYCNEAKFDSFCSQLPDQYYPGGPIYDQEMPKIGKILCFLSGKSLDQSVEAICIKFPLDEQSELRMLLKNNLKFFHLPERDTFADDLIGIYQDSFHLVHSNESEEEISKRIVSHFKRACEESTMQTLCLKLIQKNPVFTRPQIEDRSLTSSNYCLHRFIRVMLTLLRSTKDDEKPCQVYDRVDNSYVEFLLKPIQDLEGFGPLDYVCAEIPFLSEEKRKAILLATLYMKELDSEFMSKFEDKDRWKVYELLMMKRLMNYVDHDSSEQEKLSIEFQIGAQHCLIYYYAREDKNNQEFAHDLIEEIEWGGYTRSHRNDSFDCRIVHQIAQLQTAIVAFNQLNAFLGDVLQRMKPENWFNSCLMYNLTKWPILLGKGYE